MHGTTILCVRARGEVAMAGDGQVTLGDVALKHTARKVRRLRDGRILAGFAGSTADAMTLLERFEAKLDEHGGILLRAAAALAREWRTDRVLRRLEAMMLVADAKQTLLLSGAGDVLEPEEGVVGIGSGGAYARAAALALVRKTDLPASEIAREAMRIAAQLCIYTNEEIVIETLTAGDGA